VRQLLDATAAEFLKMRKSRVLPITIAAMCLAPLFGALFVIVLRDPNLAAGNEGLRAKAALTGFGADWPSFFTLIGQAIGVGGVIVFGFVASWVFGREYADKTIKDILSLPVSRTTIVLSKLLVVTAWCLVIAVCVTVVALVTGALLSLEGWDGGLMTNALQRVFIVTLLSIALCPPVSFVASAARGYLGALGFVIFTMVLAQIIGAIGLGTYVPWSVPALYSGMGAEAGGMPDALSFLILILYGGAGVIATIHIWNNADQKA